MNALTLNTSNRSEIQYFVDDKQLKISLFFYGDDLPLSENDDNINDQSFIIFVPKKKCPSDENERVSKAIYTHFNFRRRSQNEF